MPDSCQHTLHQLNKYCGMQDLQNSLSAREFVWWYNGHPDYAKLQIDLQKVMQSILRQVFAAREACAVPVTSPGYDAFYPCREFSGGA